MTGLVGVLLAAGSAARFGTHKLLAELPSGEPVGLRAALNLIQILPNSLAVIRSGDAVLSEMLAAAGLGVIENPLSSIGIAGSIVAGIRASADATGWLIILADMPWIRPTTIRTVAEAIRAGATLAAPTFGGRRGHPVGFSARWRSRLLSLQGDRGARDLLEGARHELCLLPTTDPGILQDIDFPSDLVTQPGAARGVHRGSERPSPRG